MTLQCLHCNAVVLKQQVNNECEDKDVITQQQTHKTNDLSYGLSTPNGCEIEPRWTDRNGVTQRPELTSVHWTRYDCTKCQMY